eukprot:TRINITY_DN167_c0_g3_i5.p1 TRINITY_DN167_c0_g3~~TRINITY_DN167_c0_g3_i5.p1  ORF type:complete len:602 (-),score=106.67 TRINITY_DN167_c0_g3_i5:107-1912(-)
MSDASAEEIAELEQLLATKLTAEDIKLLFTDTVKGQMVEHGLVTAAAIEATEFDELRGLGFKFGAAKVLQKAFQGAARAGAGAGSGAGGAAAAVDTRRDISGDLVQAMMDSLPPLHELPADQGGFKAVLADRTGLQIPVPAYLMDSVGARLGPQQYALLKGVPASASAAHKFAELIESPPSNLGSELTTSFAVYTMAQGVFSILQTYYSAHVDVDIKLNVTERTAGSKSSGISSSSRGVKRSWSSRDGPSVAKPSAVRPDAQFVADQALVGFGEDKPDGELDVAMGDVEFYSAGGLNRHHYGNLPGLIAYAAAGFKVAFLLVSAEGKVVLLLRLDLETKAGRIDMICVLIQWHRLLRLIVNALPSLQNRTQLWTPVTRNLIVVTLNFRGAHKTINDFKTFCKKAQNSFGVLQAAYKAAGRAAAQQTASGLQPFLVCADARGGGPTLTNRSMQYSVQTMPLGYDSTPSTEAEIKGVASACCRAADVLHDAGIVHCDFRLANVVRLDEKSWMVIDLEHCRRADEVVADTSDQLRDWDTNTLKHKENGLWYTRGSDLYQISKMIRILVKQVCPDSAGARAFADGLAAEAADLKQILRHAWLTSG